MGTLRFLLKRFVAQRMLGLAVVVTLAFSIGVLVAGPIYADAAREAILSSSVATAGVTVVNVRFTVYGDARFDQAAADAAIADATAGMPVRELVAQGLGPISLGPAGTAPVQETNAIFRTGAEDHLPNFKGQAPGVREIALPASLARSFGAQIGDPVAVGGGGVAPFTLTVSGTFDIPDAGDPFWFGNKNPFPAADSLAPLPVLLGRDGYLAVAATLGTTTEFAWDAYLDSKALTFERTESLPGQIEAAVQHLSTRPLLGSIRADDGLAALIRVVKERIEDLRVPILLVVFQIASVTLAVLAGVGTLTLTRQAFELAVLHSRGFSRQTLLAGQAMQAVFAAIVAYPLGLVLGIALAKLASTSNGPSLPGTLFPIRLTRGAELLGLGAAVVGAAILLLLSLPHVRRTVLEQRHAVSREDRPPLLRLPIELFLAPVGIFSFVQLRSTAAPKSGTGTIDPLVLLAPTLLIFAASFLALRLLLLGLRAMDRRIGRTRNLARYLAFRRLGRAPGLGFAAALLLLLSMGLLVVSTSYRAIVLRSHDDAAHQQVGGDWRIGVAPPDQPLAAIRSMPGGSTPIVRTEPRFDGGSFPLVPVALGVDPATYTGGGWWRADYSGSSLDDMMAALRSEPYGVALPTGARDLVVTLDVPRSIAGIHVAATVEGPGGEVRTAQASSPLAAGEATYVMDLGEADRLLSIALIDGGATDLPPGFTVGIGAIVADGTALPLAGFEPMTWRGSSGELDGTSLVITRGSGEVIGGLVPRSDPLPVIVSPAVADQLGTSFPLTLGAQQFEVHEIATATNFPTILPNGPFVIISAPALLERAASIPEPGLALNEVWANGEADPRPGLSRVGFIPGPVTRTAPIVGFLAQSPQALAVGLEFTAAAAGLGLVVIGVAVGLSIAQRRRDFEFAALRAMGTERGELRRAMIIEQAVLLGFAVVAGLAAGYAMLKLMLPYFGRDLAVSFPEPQLVVDRTALSVSIAAIVVATGIGLSLALVSLLRSSVTGVLRGEAE